MDGPLQFCPNYRKLSSMTLLDSCPNARRDERIYYPSDATVLARHSLAFLYLSKCRLCYTARRDASLRQGRHTFSCEVAIRSNLPLQYLNFIFEPRTAQPTGQSCTKTLEHAAVTMIIKSFPFLATGLTR